MGARMAPACAPVETDCSAKPHVGPTGHVGFHTRRALSEVAVLDSGAGAALGAASSDSSAAGPVGVLGGFARIAGSLCEGWCGRAELSLEFVFGGR